MARLVIIGPGFTGMEAARRFQRAGIPVSATARTQDKAALLEQAAIDPIDFDSPFFELPSDLSHLIMAAPVSIEKAPDWWARMTQQLENSPNLQWIGYCSTTGVYGDRGGAWTDENCPVNPTSNRAKMRVYAEEAWTELATKIGVTLHIFRLSGIYGLGRNSLRSLLDGKAKIIDKPGQLFNRIHVTDIAETMFKAAHHDPQAHQEPKTHQNPKEPRVDIFNMADDAPAAPKDPILYAATLLGIDPPKVDSFETADLSPMARSFYTENKRISNQKVKEYFGIKLTYPSYREGLSALVDKEKFSG